MFEKTKKKCVHNLEKAGSTIKILGDFKTMAVPDTNYGICVCCGKTFEFKNNKISQKGGRSDVDDRGDERQAK